MGCRSKNCATCVKRASTVLCTVCNGILPKCQLFFIKHKLTYFYSVFEGQFSDITSLYFVRTNDYIMWTYILSFNNDLEALIMKLLL